MKVLYYSPHPGLNLASPTGYGTHMRSMIAALRRTGHQVDALIVGGEEAGWHEARGSSALKNVAKALIPARLWETLKHSQRLRLDGKLAQGLEGKIKECHPDLIYERASYLQLSGVTTANRLGIPHVLEVNTPANAERRFLGQPKSFLESKAERIEKRQLELTSLAAVVSPAMIDHFQKKYGIPEDKFVCTPNGIAIEQVTVDETRVTAIRDEYDLSGRFVVGFVGCMARWQRVEILIEAIATLTKKLPQIVALLVGGTPQRNEELRRLAEQHSVSQRIRFLGQVPKADVYNFISAMDACVLPDNLWYGSPTKLFEYAALKRPTIAPDNVTIRSIMTNGEHGYLVRSDADQLANAVRRFADSPDRAARMGRNFFERVTNEFTWDKNVERIRSRLNSHAPADSLKSVIV